MESIGYSEVYHFFVFKNTKQNVGLPLMKNYNYLIKDIYSMITMILCLYEELFCYDAGKDSKFLKFSKFYNAVCRVSNKIPRHKLCRKNTIIIKWH